MCMRGFWISGGPSLACATAVSDSIASGLRRDLRQSISQVHGQQDGRVLAVAVEVANLPMHAIIAAQIKQGWHPTDA